MASARVPSNWCFLGSHVINTANRHLTADFFCCDPCYEKNIQARWEFLVGHPHPKRKPDSESHPVPDAKKVPGPPIPPPISPLASSSSIPPSVPNPFVPIRQRLAVVEADIKKLKEAFVDQDFKAARKINQLEEQQFESAMAAGVRFKALETATEDNKKRLDRAGH